MVLANKYIGLIVAMIGNLAIGTSFIITKKGLQLAGKKAAREGGGQQGGHAHSIVASDGFGYLRNGLWWAGMLTMVVGEVANFGAYMFAPPILITPLGASSVLIGAILASFFLQEKLGKIGRVACALCIIGTVMIILHAPADKEITTVDEILQDAFQPGFLLYCVLVAGFAAFMIYRIAPQYGKTSPLIYLSICSLVGSVSVMSIKAFGIALKLTFDGNNQFTHFSTYFFALVTVGCIMVQMNYFNKALDLFDTNVVNPIYYVGFTTSTLIASAILFGGFNTVDAVNTFSLLCGFITIFLGVYLLNISQLQRAQREEDLSEPLVGVRSPNDLNGHHSALETGLIQPRMSLSIHRGGNPTEIRPLTNLGQHPSAHRKSHSGANGGAGAGLDFAAARASRGSLGKYEELGNGQDHHASSDLNLSRSNGKLNDPDAQLLYSFEEDSEDEMKRP